jgi:hypothetical protein
MDEAEFWRLIGESIDREDGDWWLEAEEHLISQLEARTPDEILAFQSHLIDARNRAYRWELRGAADLMLGRECDFDAFEFFLAWVIGLGQPAYLAALTDPDALADAIPGADVQHWAPNSEPLLNAASTAYERATGEDFPWSTGPEYLKEPTGTPIEPRSLGRRFPRIQARMKARG